MNTSAFSDGITWSLIDVANVIDRYATPAIIWYCRTFFSDDAQRIYTVLGEILGDVMVLTIMAGMIARQQVQGWVDAVVEDALDPDAHEGQCEGNAKLHSFSAMPWFSPAWPSYIFNLKLDAQSPQSWFKELPRKTANAPFIKAFAAIVSNDHGFTS